MLVFNFVIPYFASLSAFCEGKREGHEKKSPHLGTKVRGFFVMPPCRRRFCDRYYSPFMKIPLRGGKEKWRSLHTFRNTVWENLDEDRTELYCFASFE